MPSILDDKTNVVLLCKLERFNNMILCCHLDCVLNISPNDALVIHGSEGITALVQENGGLYG